MRLFNIISPNNDMKTKGYLSTLFVSVMMIHFLSSQAQEITPFVSDTSHVSQMIDYLQKAMRFNLYTPQEKVYLHFDNTGYFKGEYIRFKAYVTRCDTERKTDLSHVLYVELVNPSGDVVERRKLKIVDGEADGDIKVDSIQTTGFYEVRAYTRYMTNWGSHACFSRVFPIFKSPKREGDYSRLELDKISYQKRLPNTRKDEDSVIVDTYTHAMTMRFYPEGGDMVEGLESRVAFTVSDEEGGRMQRTGYVEDDRKVRQCDIRTDSLGRGIFSITPQAGRKYFAVVPDHKSKERRYELPAARHEGTVLSFDMLGEIDITATIASSPGIQGRLIGYAVMHNGTIFECDTLTAANTHTLKFNRFVLPEGVNQLTVFDSSGSILAERLFFICPVAKEQDSIRITSRTTRLTPCCKVSFNIQSEPNASISFSAIDAATINNGWEGNMKTWTLLASEVRGYIAHPEYYFEADDDRHRRDADLLMMIQGWRRYDFRLMAGLTDFEKRQPIEDKLYLFGQIKSKRKKYSPDDVEITATMYNKKGEVIDGTLKTDSVGKYNYIVPDVEGEWTLFMRSKKDDVERDYYIGIDRHFSPDKRYIYPDEARIQQIRQPNFIPSAQNAVMDDEEPVSITQRNHLLPTVKVKTRRILGDLRVNWYDEENAQTHSVLRYDCDEDADMYGDLGNDIPSFFEWLSKRNSYFQFEKEDYDAENMANWVVGEMDDDGNRVSSISLSGKRMFEDRTTYNERPIIWIVDNTFWGITGLPNRAKEHINIIDSNNKTDDISLPDMLDVAKSIYISEDLSSMKTYLWAENLQGYNPVIFYVYQHPLFGFKQKGLRRTHFDGFNVPTAFEMEDYSVMPPAEDFRRTLYWEPNIKTNNRGRATVEFYNNSSCTSMFISAEGITENGKFIINE